MPAIVASLIRTLIQAAGTTALFVVIEKIIGPVVDAAKRELSQARGLTDEEAQDTIANEIIDAFTMIGILGVAIRTKLPTIVAEKLGFTSKGYAKRTIKKTSADVAVATPSKVKQAWTLLPIWAKLSFAVFGGSVAWNYLTDWVWIGDSLKILPTTDQDDIQKRALSILNLLDSPRTLIYSAEKQKRQLSQQERDLVKTAADEAERQINDLKRVYSSKFALYGRQNVQNQLNNSTNALLIELNILRQMGGLIPRAPVRKVVTEATVEVVFDGDTIKLDNGETVRLVGIDAPESTTAAGEKAKAYLKARLTGKKVRVESDPDHVTDIYGRRLGVVYLDE